MKMLLLILLIILVSVLALAGYCSCQMGTILQNLVVVSVLALALVGLGRSLHRLGR